MTPRATNFFKPSPQQNDFFGWVDHRTGSCVLEAVAGSGKTSTLILALKRMAGYVFFGAYNKKIADEISGKAGHLSNVTVQTMHAAGRRIWMQSAKFFKVDANKCRMIFMDIVDNPDYNEYMGAVLSLVSYAKQAAFNVSKPATMEDWYNLIDHFSVDTLDEDEIVIGLAKDILAESIRLDHDVIDFDDMIYAPLIHRSKPKFRYNWVLIDEAQDTNAARRALALLLLAPNGRLVAVGDRHQAIYGFTGADSDALDQIAQEVTAVRLPLTVSYRCPKLITEYARNYVQHIESADTAQDGVVSRLQEFDEILTSAKIGDAILCRFNAPIVQLAYSFISKGIPAKVEGRDLGTNLKTLARRWKVKSISVLRDKLSDYLDKQTEKLLEKKREAQVSALEDRVRCLFVLINRVEDIDPNTKNIVESVCAEIDNIFGDNVDAKTVILLSTIHKSKGREWKKVFYIQGQSKRARQDWEKECEINLKYVAITRAQEELVLVPEPPKQEKDLVSRCIDDMRDKGC